MRQYLERDICNVLDYISKHDIEVSGLTEWVRAIVLPHLWGRGLIETEIVRERHKFLSFVTSERRILRLTPFGKRELDQFNMEQQIALQNIENSRP